MIRRILKWSALLWAASAAGQALEPRFYSNAPKGLSFTGVGYGLSVGPIATDPSVNIDGELRSHIGVVAYASSFGLFGKSAKFDMTFPYAYITGSGRVNGTPREGEIHGLADPVFRGSINLVGAPALSWEEFADYRQNFILGASLKVAPPLGRYEPDSLISPGANRWAISPEIGASKAFGPLILELAGAVTFFTPNDDYFGARVEREPVGSLQGHAIYTFRPGLWVALNATRYGGGRTTTDGVDDAGIQQSTRFGATFAVPVSKRDAIKFYGNVGVQTRVGGDFDAVGVAWQRRWGGPE